MVIKCGLEVHGYIQTENNKKLFCDCDVSQEASPNTNICPICTGQPGSKPMLPNKSAIEKAIAISLMLDCKINQDIFFQRKHYDWPDMPTGFQKTNSGAHSFPIGVKGNFLGINITQVHIEEDPAKWDPKTGSVDYNRSGTPLIEIVTEPEFTSPEQVQDWLKKLVTTLKYIKSLDITAGIKSDVNVSTEPKHKRVEIKNVNSITSIVNAIKYETKRQTRNKERGEEEKQHTRRWNDEKQKTDFMRSKEEAQDYRFIKEPDLPKNHLKKELIEKIEKLLPEKPHEKLEKYRKQGIEETDAKIISSDIYVAELFEKIIEKVDILLATKWIRGQLLSVMNYNQIGGQDLNINFKELIKLLKKLEENKITDEVGRKIIRLLAEEDLDVEEYIKKNNLEIISNSSEIEKYCKQAIKENPQSVEDYKNGNEKALNFLVGSVMRKTKGKSSPQETTKILKKIIK